MMTRRHTFVRRSRSTLVSVHHIGVESPTPTAGTSASGRRASRTGAALTMAHSTQTMRPEGPALHAHCPNSFAPLAALGLPACLSQPQLGTRMPAPCGHSPAATPATSLQCCRRTRPASGFGPVARRASGARGFKVASCSTQSRPTNAHARAVSGDAMHVPTACHCPDSTAQPILAPPSHLPSAPLPATTAGLGSAERNRDLR